MANRRNFIKAFFSTSFGLFLVSVFYPLIRFLVPPSNPESTSLSVVAARTEELPPNSGLLFRFGSRPGIVVRGSDGRLKAYSATCTHLDCTVQYRADLEGIYCACHEGIYDINGVPISGPPPRPLEEFDVQEKRGEIVVSRSS